MNQPQPYPPSPSPSLIDEYRLPIRRESYPAVFDLIRQGIWVPKDGRGREFRLATEVPVRVPDDRTCWIGNEQLTLEVYRLPGHTYSALATYDRQLQAYPGTDDLWSLMQSSRSPAEVTTALREVVATGRQPVTVPPLVRPDPLFRAAWVPEMTTLREQSGEYLLGLSFVTGYLPTGLEDRRFAVGLDLNLQPMTVAYHQDGSVREFTIRSLTLPDRMVLTPDERGLVDQIVYATGRVASQEVITHLVTRAERVYAEELRLGGMAGGYRKRARSMAIHDHHYAWLPQLLRRAGVKFRRVPSGQTSVECPRCRCAVPGNRQGPRFTCQRCGFTGLSHRVAAANIFHRGWRDDPQAQRLYPWPVPPHSQQ